ncbi:hypothetical protein X907_1511 [Glycocaulis alkaliphilus]|uniref:Uncharacterized protein n=1 Tax=Glycocaulis alkaliphilus TaxID=1434191 RepID=A0A3T0E9N4_9PROT|nr:DUF4198 domain-containing protein [Glycocaulis alkaliphilus]AZU04044.1 hypothetical protein X907_1511 [Glycocaulis alkaliphilus]GGB75356.1 ABC transporter permease [Glycocaulis alkaliphilus]
MTLFRSFTATAAGLALMATLTTAAEAHRMWLYPSATVLSGEDPWVTIDAAISNDLFYFEHHPLRLEGLVVTGPGGAPVDAQNAATGRYRSTFDIQLTEPGTYRVAIASSGLFASYTINGERQRWRGTPERFAAEIPAGADNLQVTELARRVEAFTTRGAPDTGALSAQGSGLELVPVTHPNDLFAGESAQFQLVLEGQPAAGIEVEIVPGGSRYRDQVGDWTVSTDAQGIFTVIWPEAGMYWLEASVNDDNPSFEGATNRRATYVATLEVLPQ